MNSPERMKPKNARQHAAHSITLSWLWVYFDHKPHNNLSMGGVIGSRGGLAQADGVCFTPLSMYSN